MNKHQRKKSITHSHSAIMRRYSWRKINFFKHFSFSRSKKAFQNFSSSIDHRFDRKISKPTGNNLSTAAELSIAVLNLLNFCQHAFLL